MLKLLRVRSLSAVSLMLVQSVATAQVPASSFVNFEAAQTNPIRLSPDGSRLFAVNTADARVSVFDLAQPSVPRLVAEIPVGIEPVSVAARDNDEAWVVNQVSDSISIISVSRGIVTDTIFVKDEPADIVFAANKAFVSLARSNQIAVIDIFTHAVIKKIPVLGHNPRALAVSPNGSTVFAAFALSGNRTTVVPLRFSPPQPPPTNPALPSPPATEKIIDATDAAWASSIKYKTVDNDIVAINTSTLAPVKYFPRVGTVNLGLAVRPSNGELWVSNTDARNLITFEPNLRGHFLDNRVSRIQMNGQTSHYDLNVGIDYNVLPNPAALSTAIAQPAGLAFSAAGRFLYIAGFGTDRIAVFDVTNGTIVKRIEVGNTPGSTVDSANKRGPRGLALNSNTQRLYVLNRISNTISIIQTSTNSLVGQLPVGSYDPTPVVIRQGRGFMYDAKLSGNGTAACAGCHIDGDTDFLAWDLGDPGGSISTALQNGKLFEFHPMKGVMVTQPLRGLKDLSPFHWRGDRANLDAFNPAFDSLLGGSMLSETNMAKFSEFMKTSVFQPNPFQNLDRTMPASIELPGTLGAGEPNVGMNIFLNEVLRPVDQPGVTCNSCHKADPGPGSNRLLQLGPGTDQTVKTPHLRMVYQKLAFNNISGANSILGTGFGHGGEQTLIELLSREALGTVAASLSKKIDVFAMLMCFDTGMAPAVGYSRTLTSASVSAAPSVSDWNTLEAQAAASNIDLIIKGSRGGAARGFVYRPSTNNYQSDSSAVGVLTRAQLASGVSGGDTLTIMGVPPGTGVRMGVDRNLDGVLDGDTGVQ